jgi:hypothetical protein
VIAATNNHYKGKAAANAIDLKRLLGIKDNPVPENCRRPIRNSKSNEAIQLPQPVQIWSDCNRGKDFDTSDEQDEVRCQHPHLDFLR